MSFEKTGGYSPEFIAEVMTEKLIEILGTPKVAFCFRTAMGSIYVADNALRTTRYKAATESFDMVSKITVFLDGKYMDSQQTSRSSREYLPNSNALEDGFLVLDDTRNPQERKIKHIETWNDLGDSIDVDTLKTSLFFVVFDAAQNKIVKKAPVSIFPSVGSHPIEFCDPENHRLGHRNHLGHPIVNLTITSNMPEDEAKKAVEAMALLSLTTS